MKSYAIGVDVGGTTVKIGLFQVDGQLIQKWEISTDKREGGSRVLSDIAASLKEKMREHQISPDDVEGVGIGVPGAVQDFSLVHGAVNIGWGEVRISDILSGLLYEIPVRAANDANCAALGEMWMGGARGYQTLVMATLGTGVGGGIVIDGKVLEGAFGAAGEIGHICVEPLEEKACGCGGHGHLEQYASATGIVRLAAEILEQKTAPSLMRDIQEPLNAKEVFHCAKRGDDLALQVVDRASRYLGRALAAISCVVDPQIILIGGGVSKAGSMLTDAVTAYYRQYAFFASRSAPIRLAVLGNDAGICGAARLVLPD